MRRSSNVLIWLFAGGQERIRRREQEMEGWKRAWTPALGFWGPKEEQEKGLNLATTALNPGGSNQTPINRKLSVEVICAL
jgi:hypothetical protein